MKWKTILLSAIIICVIMGTVAIIPRICRGQWITPSQVQRVEFRGPSSCEGPEPSKFELSDSEIRTLVSHFRHAAYAGKVNGENCDHEFSFVIYLTDGTKISAREAAAPRIYVKPPHAEAYWIRSKSLTNYAKKLIQQHQ